MSNFTGFTPDRVKFLSNGDDEFRDRQGSSKIYARGGDDIIFAFAERDIVFGGAGNDQIFLGDGNDKASGNSGDDTIWAGSGSDVVRGGDGSDFIILGAGSDIGRGGSGADVIHGTEGSNVLLGGGGADILLAADDDGFGDGLHFSDSGNFLSGNSGDDQLFAGRGNMLNGGSGDDRLHANDFQTFDLRELLDIVDLNDLDAASDQSSTLTGGSGADSFFSSGGSRILDFNANEGDTITLEALVDFDFGAVGTLDIVQILPDVVGISITTQRGEDGLELGDFTRTNSVIVRYEDGIAPTAADITISDGFASAQINAEDLVVPV